MRFGLSLPIVQQVPGRAQPWEAHAGPSELLRVARAADRLGFAWITCSDHIAVPASRAGAMGATWYEPATTLAFLAAVTERVRLLSHVVVLPYRHPLTVAKAYATLDHLSGGRVIIGVGTGHLKPEFRSLGVEYAERNAIADEYLRALGVALEREVSTFEGHFVRWRDLMIVPRPRQAPRPPIWLGGNSRAAARRAAALADGWIPWQVTPDALRVRAADVKAVRGAAERDGAFDVVAPLTVARTQAPAQIAAQVAAWREAGATAFHVGFEHASCDELLERMELFQRGVIRA